VRRPTLAALAALALTLATAAPAQARSADIVNADVALRLTPQGALYVVERLTYEYDGHFEGSYRDIELLHGETVSDVQVSTGGDYYEPGGNTALGSHDRPGVFGVDVADFGRESRARIVWHYRATDEVRTYTIAYRVDKAAVAYDDVIDIGWTVWGDQWDFDLERLEASFAHPGLDPADPLYRVWGHPRDVEGETARTVGLATLDATDVDSGTAVEFRITMPRGAAEDVSGMRVKPGDGLPDILAEEKALDEDFNAFWPRTKRFIADNVAPASLGLAGLAAALIVLLAWFARERRTSVPEYVAEPPDDAPPALAYALSHEGGDSTNTVLATLLDLVDRGYYESSSTTTSDEKLDLAIKLKDADRPPADDLREYEQEVLEFFDELLDSETVAISDLRDRLPAHSETWRARWRSMTEELKDAEQGELEFDLDLSGWARLLILGVIAAFALVTIAYIDVEEKWFLPIFVGIATVIAIAAVPNRLLRRVDAKHRERTAKWTAFAHWTEDFPRLKDDPPQTLELWRRIMVYGVAFGTAERMIKSGRIPEPVMAESQSSGGWSSYAFAHSFNFSALNGSTFGAGIASQVAPVTSSSGGGGGGFSGGGGGGFSGGGGGGSW
jgi:uncharacterized membrane protein